MDCTLPCPLKWIMCLRVCFLENVLRPSSMTIWSLESSSSINKENHDEKQVDKFSMRFYQKVIHCTARCLVERT